MNGKYQRKQEEDPQALRELGKKLGFTEDTIAVLRLALTHSKMCIRDRLIHHRYLSAKNVPKKLAIRHAVKRLKIINNEDYCW